MARPVGLLGVGPLRLARSSRGARLRVGEGGAFYTGRGGQLGASVIGTLAVLTWTLSKSFVVFGSLKAAKLLRVTAEEEVMGVDLAEHLPREDVLPLSDRLRRRNKETPREAA